MPLHLTKIAYGCESLAVLDARLKARAADGEIEITTRYRPTRHAELIGGSLYWIVRHSLAARQRILGFEAEGGRWRIRLAMPLVPVHARPRRAHQGWRYLADADAPADLADDMSGLAEMPPAVLEELAKLALI